MSVETTAPFRRVVGTLIRGVADGLLGGAQGIPLAGAQVTATASVKSAASGEFIVLDPVDGTTDQNARLRNATTGEEGILLLVTDDASIGVIGWTWHITITAPSLHRPGQPPRTVEFDIDVPSGEGDLDLATLVPVPGNVGEDVILWREAVEQTAQNVAATLKNAQDALAYRNTALSYRDQTNTHRANAVTAQNNAYGARDAALASATAAALSASMVQDAVMRAPSMILNGGFELGTGAAATGWTLTAANADRVAANAYRGSASMLLPQSGNVSEIMSDAAPTEGNRWVRLSAMYRTSSDSASLGGLRIQYSSNGTTWTQLGASPAFPHSAVWASFEIRRQIPVGALFVRARIVAAPNSPTIRVDEVRLDDITELVAAETAAAAANTAYQNSTQSLAITGNTLTATRVNGTTYNVGTVTVPGPQGPAGKLTGNGDNLILDPNLKEALEDNWTLVAGSAAAKATVSGAPGNAIRIFGPGVRIRNNNQIPVSNLGETFWLGAWVQNTGTAGKLFLRIVERTIAGVYIRARTVEVPVSGWTSVGGLAQISGIALGTLQTNTTAFVEFELESDARYAGQAWLTSLEMRSTLRMSEVTTETLTALETRKGRVAVFTGSSNVLTGGWPTLLSASMGWTEKNYAVGGTGFAQGTNGTPTGPNTFQEQLANAVADTSFVNSDVGYVFIGDAGNDSLSAQTAAAIGTAADSAIAYAQAQFPNAIVVLVPMLWGPHAWHDTGAAWIKMLDVVEQLRRVSTERKIEFTEDSWLWHHNDASSMLSGEVHFTAGGHAIIRDRVAQHLRTGSSTPIREWNTVGAANANITVAPDSGGDYRGLSVKRVGGEVSLQGRMVTSAVANNATWAVVPNGFRPTYAQEVHCRIGTLSTVGVISKNGNITVYANASAGATVTFGATYRVD